MPNFLASQRNSDSFAGAAGQYSNQNELHVHRPRRGSQLSVHDVVKSYDKMHRAVEHNTKYFRVDPIQYILLRRGSQWRPMIVKISICLLGLFFSSQMRAKGLIETVDKSFV